MLIQAGRTLALRRQKGGYLASFIGPQSLFIDIMMNVGIILWAANATGDDALRADRPGTLPHDAEIPRPRRRRHGPRRHLRPRRPASSQRESTHQGYAPESTWTRGLAWAIYGFTAVHRLSGEKEFLETAAHAPTATCGARRRDLVPPWDFDAPGARPAARQLGRGDRGQRAVGPGGSGERPRAERNATGTPR